MTVAGRCHGPGCQREARVEYFCGELCQAAWSRQLAGLAVNANVPPGRSAIRHAPASPFLLNAVEDAMPAVRAELDQRSAAMITQARQHQIAHTAPGSMMEDIQRAYDLVRDVQPPEPVKLTREQLDTLRRDTPPAPGYIHAGAVNLAAFMGVPIELVETVEESTPYLEQRKRLAAAIRDRARGTSPREDGLTPLYQYLPPSGLDAEFPLVASPSPQVAQSGQGPRWRRWLHRMRRTEP